tara:strand:- start:44 stop:571 length:528 start_codon:yes stop_codon:yes gene_type:complete
MAIKDMKGTVSMTGMVNAAPPKIEAPDMSNMKMPAGMAKDKPEQVAKKPAPQNTPREEGLLQRVQNLTNEDKNLLSTFLSPSVTTVLSKVAPEIEPLLKQFTKDEENVVLPVSIVKNFASRKYPGTEQESIQSFVSDLAGQMEQETTVPPDTQMVQAPESDVNYDAIDSDTMAIS